MKIILMGYRGSGKTSIGKKIADQTWKEFVDTDTEVVKRFAGRSIADIWQTDGEAAFRKTEAEVTQELLKRDNHVIALGGGAVMDPATAEAIRDTTEAKRIYLAAKPTVLAERIAADARSAESRPSLTGGAATASGDVEEITAVLEQRDPVYRELADVVFDVSYVDVAQAVAYLSRHHL
ncbi:MAG: shikimate kinase [Planctomycetota bacterium]